MITAHSLRTTRIVTNFLIICSIAIGLIFLWPLLHYRQNDRYKCNDDLLSCTASVFGESDQCHSNACWVSFGDKFIMKSRMTFNMYDKFVENDKTTCLDKPLLKKHKNIKERCKPYKNIDSWLDDDNIKRISDEDYIKGLSTDKIKLICRDILFFEGLYKNKGRLMTEQEFNELRKVKHKELNTNKPCSTMYKHGMCDLSEFEMQNEGASDYDSTFRCVAEGSEIVYVIE